MYRRLDPLNYEKKLKPFCKKYDKILDKNDIIKLQSIKIPKNKDFGLLTRKNTTTHQCCDKYSEDEINWLITCYKTNERSTYKQLSTMFEIAQKKKISAGIVGKIIKGVY